MFVEWLSIYLLTKMTLASVYYERYYSDKIIWSAFMVKSIFLVMKLAKTIFQITFYPLSVYMRFYKNRFSFIENVFEIKKIRNSKAEKASNKIIKTTTNHYTIVYLDQKYIHHESPKMSESNFIYFTHSCTYKIDILKKKKKCCAIFQRNTLLPYSIFTQFSRKIYTNCDISYV